MPKPSLDKATKKAILYARSLVEAIAKADKNESETRKRIDYILENLMGYDTFKHITQEYAIHGAGGMPYIVIFPSNSVMKRHQSLT